MATGGTGGGTVTYITITGPPVSTQDDNGIWTSVVSYSDGTSFTVVCGLDIPIDYDVVQAASIYLAQNQNQAALAGAGLIPPI